jgi:glyceraldehyde 3-phosphate dehydrogenase
MAVKVAINGFGRIGRQVFKVYMEKYQKDYEIVALNDLTDTKTLAHLYKYDSIYGRAKETVSATDDAIVINGKNVKVYAEKDPANLPWKELGVDIVIESTGFFRSKAAMQKHIDAGAKKVLLSAPAKSGDDVDLTVVIGVNDGKITKDMTMISNASCTTNSMAGVVKAINDAFGIQTGLMTTIHSYTNDQKILDAPHSDLRRARNAATNIIPTSTGAAKAIGLVIPDLKGKLDGIAMRVPTAVGSVTDMTFKVGKNTTAEEVNGAVKKACDTYLKDTVEYCTDPIVLSDIVGSPYSSIFDSLLTSVMDGNIVKVCAWYDNEWGFSNRLAHLTSIVSKMV